MCCWFSQKNFHFSSALFTSSSTTPLYTNFPEMWRRTELTDATKVLIVQWFDEGVLCAEITIDSTDDRYFDRSTDSLKAEFANAVGPGRERVEVVLHNAQQMVFVRVLSGGRDDETTLSQLDVLWDWLFGTRYLPRGRRPKRYGVLDKGVPRGFLGLLAYPFLARGSVRSGHPEPSPQNRSRAGCTNEL